MEKLIAFRAYISNQFGLIAAHCCLFPFSSVMFNLNINTCTELKGMEHVPNIFMSFDKYLFLEVINILVLIGLFKQSELQLVKKYLKTI